MTEPPRISVITVCLNQSRFLEETLRSVLDQEYPNLEYLVVDGGSQDGSVDIIRRYEAQLDWWVSEPDNGQSDAINKGFAHATGSVVAFLNGDDLYLPGALQVVAEEFAAEGFDLLAGACRYIDAGGATVGRVKHYPRTRADFMDLRTYEFSYLTQPEVFLSAELVSRLGPLRSDMHFAFDYEYWVRAASRGAVVRHTERELACFRRHGAQKTQGGWRARSEDVDVVREYLSAAELTTGERDRIVDGLHWFEARLARQRVSEVVAERRWSEALAQFVRFCRADPAGFIRWVSSGVRHRVEGRRG